MAPAAGSPLMTRRTTSVLLYLTLLLCAVASAERGGGHNGRLVPVEPQWLRLMLTGAPMPPMMRATRGGEPAMRPDDLVLTRWDLMQSIWNNRHLDYHKRTVPTSGGVYGKRGSSNVAPPSGGIYGKRAAIPSSGGVYGKRAPLYLATALPTLEGDKRQVPQSGSIYGKRSLPANGGLYG